MWSIVKASCMGTWNRTIFSWQEVRTIANYRTLGLAVFWRRITGLRSNNLVRCPTVRLRWSEAKATIRKQMFGLLAVSYTSCVRTEGALTIRWSTFLESLYWIIMCHSCLSGLVKSLMISSCHVCRSASTKGLQCAKSLQETLSEWWRPSWVFTYHRLKWPKQFVGK